MEEYKSLFIRNAGRLIDFYGKTILEVGCGSGDMLREIAGNYYPKYIVGIDVDLAAWSARAEAEANWEIAEGNATSMNFKEATFDAVISVGVFEHILDLRGAFSEIRRVLKPGGKLYTEFSPIWSSITGHHYNFWVEKDAGLVPGWGHLWMKEDEMRSFLGPRTGKEQAEQACREIYHGSQINRLKRADYYDIFIKSGLQILELHEHISYSSRYMFGGTTSELSPDICARLKNSYSPAELGVLGFTLLMEKPVQLPECSP